MHLVLGLTLHLRLQAFSGLSKEDTALGLGAGCGNPGGLSEMGRCARRGRGKGDRPQRGRQLGDSASFGLLERRGLLGT